MSVKSMRYVLNEPQIMPHFIGSWFLPELDVCDQMIEYFEHNQGQQRPGVSGSGYLRKDVKDSIDMPIKPLQVLDSDKEFFRSYFNSLHLFYSDYLDQWPFLGSLFESLDIGSFNLQRYNVGQHFKKLHTESLTALFN